VRIGPWQLRRDDPDSAEDPSAYMDRLEELAEVLHGLPWMLGGGLAIPVTLGRFYRSHYDLDIVFPVEAFPDIEAAMRRASFQLWTYFPFSLFGRVRSAIHLPVRAGGWIAQRRMRKLKFRDASGQRRRPHLLSLIECYPYRLEDNCIVTCDGRHRIPLIHPIVGHRHTTSRGHEIACFDLSYVAYFKVLKREPKHAEDLNVIRRARTCQVPLAH
jgi:hypothetical protein